MPTERWRSETIFEPVLPSVRIPVTNTSLTTGSLHNINTVSPAVTARDTLGLAVKTKTKTTYIAKLTHSRLRCGKRVQVAAGHAHRSSALDAPMRRCTIGSESRSLKR